MKFPTLSEIYKKPPWELNQTREENQILEVTKITKYNGIGLGERFT